MGGRTSTFPKDDRLLWFEVMAEVCRRFNWVRQAWCQMRNHCHMAIETPDVDFSVGMCFKAIKLSH